MEPIANGSCVRISKPDIPVDLLNKKAQWKNVEVQPDVPRFPNIGYIGGKYIPNSVLYSTTGDENFIFDATFTISFWAKINVPYEISPTWPAMFILALDDDNVISEEIPSTITSTDWNFFDITRTIDGTINMRVNGETIFTTTNTTPLDLFGGSYVFIGNLGFVLSLDEVLITDVVLWEDEEHEVPTKYLVDVPFKYYLFVKTSTGEVWGCQEEA